MNSIHGLSGSNAYLRVALGASVACWARLMNGTAPTFGLAGTRQEAIGSSRVCGKDWNLKTLAGETKPNKQTNKTELKAVWFIVFKDAFCQLVISNWSNSLIHVLYLMRLCFVSIFNDCIYFFIVSHTVYKIKRYKKGCSEKLLSHPWPSATHLPPPEVNFLCLEVFYACFFS